jgi:hypothetical protein
MHTGTGPVPHVTNAFCIIEADFLIKTFQIIILFKLIVPIRCIFKEIIHQTQKKLTGRVIVLKEQNLCNCNTGTLNTTSLLN